MTIGNFYPNNSTNFISYNPLYLYRAPSYYLFDDFSVYECDAVSYTADAGPGTSICRGEKVQLGTTDFPDYWYEWSEPGGKIFSRQGRPWVSPTETTTYHLLQKDFKFDESYSSVTIIVEDCDKDLVIPNVITPNGDGANDRLVILNESRLQYTLRIFDRWGTEVFTGTEESCWEGTRSKGTEYMSEQAGPGVYYYYIDAVTRLGEKRRYTGAVQVIR